MTHKAPIPSKVRSVRADAEAWEVLEWWAEMVGTPIGTLLRQAIEDTADDIIAALAPDVDESLPDDMLLKRVRHRVAPPTPRRPLSDVAATVTADP